MPQRQRITWLWVCLITSALLLPAARTSAAGLDLTGKAYLDCGDIMNTPQGTMECWVKPATINNNEWLLSKSKDKNNSMVLGFGPRIFLFQVRTNGQYRYVQVAKKTVTPGKWHHVACTFDKDKVSLFVNGIPYRKVSDPGGNYSLDHLAGGSLFLGKGGGKSKEYYNGLIAEVRLSDVVRYQRSFKPQRAPFAPDDNTVALYHFDKDGNTVADASGKGNHGKIVGSAARISEDIWSASTAPAPTAPIKPQPLPVAQPAVPVALQPAPVVAPAKPLPAGFTSATIRGDGTLLINGKPVFPIAARSEKLHEIEEVAAAGFNMILGSGEWGIEHYNRAREKGLLIFAGHHCWMSFRGVPKEFNVTGREETLLKTVIMNARDQSKRTIHETLQQFDHLPGVMGWCISDEPEAKLSEIAEAGYEIFKSNTPGHVVAQISCDPHWFKNFRHAADVLMVDDYAFQGTPRNRPYRRGILETYSRVKQAVDDMGGKPVWLMPGLYDPSYWSWKPEESLTLRDMRLANYAGLIAGAKGIVMYHWGNLRNEYSEGEDGKRKTIQKSDEQFAAKVKMIATSVAELHQLGPIIINGRPAEDIWVHWVAPGRNGPGPQVFRVMDYEGKRYLMVVNFLDVAIKGQAYGINMSVNRRAYETEVWLGGEDLSVVPERRPGENTFTVGPRGAGVFVLTRIPIPDVKR